MAIFGVVGYDNVFRLSAATVTASTAETANPAALAYDWKSSDWWIPTTSPAYLTVDCATAQPIDYWAVFSPNIADVSGALQLEYSTDNFSADITAAGAAVTPADNRVVMRTFAQASRRYARIKVTWVGAVAPRIAVASVGASLTLPKPWRDGFQIPSQASDDSLLYNRTDGGYLDGAKVIRRGVAGSFVLTNIEPADVRSDLLPWLEHMPLPWFISWDADNYPDEAILAYTTGSARPSPSYLDRFRQQVQIDYRGVHVR